MSAEGQSYVEKYSPYVGNTYQVHLRLGLLSNDAHGFEIYCGDEYLADMCRCSVRTVKRAKAQMVRDGFLRPLQAAVGRKKARYEFIFKGLEIGGQNDTLQKIGGHLRPNRGTSATSSPIYTNECKESETAFSESQSVAMPAGFRESLGLVKTLDHGLANH